MKISTKSTFFRKHTPPNVAIPHLLVYSRPVLVYFSDQKWNLKNFNFPPIIKSMFSLYNLKNMLGNGFPFLNSIFFLHQDENCVLHNFPAGRCDPKHPSIIGIPYLTSYMTFVFLLPILSVSVRFGIGATSRTHRGIQWLLYAVFLSGGRWR